MPVRKGWKALILNFPQVKPRAVDTKAPSTAAGFKKWQCALCSFAYDEALGMPEEGIPAGTRWEDVPDTWSCPVDSIQQRLTSYACGLNYDGLSPEAIHAAKVRIIDTLGALIGGFFGEPCRIARNLAAQMPNPDGATVIGTRMKTTPDMAAFVNATTARYVGDDRQLPLAGELRRATRATS